MKSSDFLVSDDALETFSRRLVELAAKKGASASMASVSETAGLSVSVRLGDVETIEKTRDKVAAVTVYLGQHRGNASTSDFSDDSLSKTVDAAIAIASQTSEDDAAGLPAPELLCTEKRDLGLYHYWDITPEQAVEIGRKAEAAAMGLSPEIKNSEGSNVNVYHAHFSMANSLGVANGYRTSSHSFSVCPIAGEKDTMQRDYWYTRSRNPALLDSPEDIGKKAGERALARVGAKSIPTCKTPVLFESQLATGLIRAFVGAVSGGALYRKASFLLDSLGQQVFADHIGIAENPFVPGAYGSEIFDEELVATKARNVVEGGIVNGYFLSTYTARKLGMQTTGHSGGAHRLILSSSKTASGDTFDEMLRKMDRGFLVTELLGHGINPVTGDYSRGASGFWVENGRIAYPVQEVTIAGNLKTMFRQIAAVGSDTEKRGAIETGSILIEEMTLAGQ